ncbi:MAG TPA: hypothetical protein VGG19_09420 [Tepidisphaeraceae bacterium]|jgi:hypothetical protein
MANVAEIEQAIEQLSPEELRVFRKWFAERDAAEWDRQIEVDVATGRLDALAEEALTEFRQGRCSEL